MSAPQPPTPVAWPAANLDAPPISVPRGAPPSGAHPGGIGSAAVRVLHVINGEHYSGAERVQDLLARRLPEFGFEVGFACLKAGLFPRMRQSTDAPLYDVSMRTSYDFRAVSRIVRVIRGEGYRIIHTHTPRAAAVGRGAAAWTGVPFVHHVHSPASQDTTRWWSNWLNGRIERLTLTGASRLIAVSASLSRHMQRAGFDANRIAVVPNGVPPTAAVRRRSPPSSSWTLGVVALFRPRKGMEVLLDALALLRSEGLPARLRAVGPFETPQYEAELKARVARHKLVDQVCWTGFSRDVGTELAQMDLFVMPSLFGEGLPMVVLEAMAAGVPVVGTRVEGIPEAVRDGVDGVLAQPGDVRDLARAIARVLKGELDWAQLRGNAWRRQAERFSDRSMAEGVAAAYRAALDNGLGAKDAT